MDIDKCTALLHVLKVGSLSQAAEDLDYTTSGMSRLIQALEVEVGFPLLIRSRKGVTPTPECQALLPTLHKLVHSGEELKQVLEQLNGNEIGTLNIGSSYRTYYHWFMPLISSFIKIYPKIKINLLTLNSTEMLEAMSRHEIDFCIVSERKRDLNWIPLQDNPIVAWLPLSHPLAHTSVPLTLFETESYIDTCPNEDTDNHRIFQLNGIKPNTQFTTTDNYATYCMVEAGLGIGLNNGLNSDGWKGSVAIRPLEPPQSVVVGIAHPMKDQLSPIAKKFIDHVLSETN